MKKNVIFLIILMIFAKTYAQQTLNFCKDNVYHYFPATVSENFKGHFSMPFLSNINFHVSQNAITFGEIFQLADDTRHGKDAALKAAKFNKFNVGLNIETLGFGFGVKNNYFTFSNRIRSEVYGLLPGDIADLLIKAYSDPADIGKEFNGSAEVNANVYNETALGYRRKINNMFSVGARVKFLVGHANYTTKSSDISFNTDQAGTLYYKNNFTILSSVPFDRTKMNNLDYKSVVLSSFKNYGAGIDLGFNVNFPFGLELRTSVLDLGFIQWKNGNYNLDVKVNPNSSSYRNGTIAISGMNLSEDDIFNINLPGFGGFYKYNKKDSIFNGFWSFKELDSIPRDAFIMEKNAESYVTMTNPKLFFEASYNISIHKFAFLTRVDFARKHVYPLVTFGYSINVKKVMDVAVSYSIAKGYYENLGLAIAFNAANVFHIYIATDNILAPILATLPLHAGGKSKDFYNYRPNFANIQLGIYFTIPQSNKIVNTSLMRSY